MINEKPHNTLSSFGIIGGMGPASTVKFLSLLVDLFRDCRGAMKNSEFPRMVLYTVPDSDHMTPDADLAIVKYLETAFSLFEQANVQFVVAPCNTVHRFFPLMKDERRFSILSIVDSVWKTQRAKLEGKRVLALSTVQTKTSGIYDELFSKASAEVTFVSEADQQVLDKIIIDVNAGSNLKDATERLLSLVMRYDYEVIFLACTELSLLLTIDIEIDRTLIIDSLQALAEATFLAATGSELS